MQQKKRLALIGGGRLSAIVARAYAEGWLEAYDLVGIWSRTFASAQKTAEIAGCPAFETFEELLSQKPDCVAEIAGVSAVRECAAAVLSAGAELIALSCGAFADDAFFAEVRACAEAHNTRVHIPSGAVGGFDVLQTLSLMARAAGTGQSVEFRARKKPDDVKNTPLYGEDLRFAEREVFSGTAREAIALLPGHVNVAVATSLATTGPENTHVSITCTPDFVGDDFRILAETGEYRTELNIYSGRHDIAAWSVVTLLRNLASPISFH